MVTGIPKTFISSGGDYSANYDWTDLASGTGYVTYYGCEGKDSTGYVFFLSDRAVDCSYLPYTDGITERNFDIEFNTPRYVSGTGIIEFTHYHGANKGSTITFYVYHVNSAAVETQIGTVVSDGRINGATATTWRDTVKVALTGTGFGVGEKLRLSVTGSTDSRIWHDATNIYGAVNNDGKAITTDLSFHVPFRIAL